jgi:hypothetical protein
LIRYNLKIISIILNMTSTNNTEMNFENKNEEELLEMFEKYIENEYDENEFKESYVLNNYSFWVKDYVTGDNEKLRYEFALSHDRTTYDYCNVIYNGDLIQEIHNKSCMPSNIWYNVWLKNDDLYVIKKDNPINELLEKITETDNEEGIMLMTEESVFTEYESYVDSNCY